MDLWRRDPGTAGILHRFDHILDEAAHPRRPRIIDLGGAAAQNGVPHAGDLQESHAFNM
jgi:hypothetical protein